MKKQLFVLLLFPLVFACGFDKPDSEVQFPKLISQGMVLQRDAPIKIWGRGIPDEKIRASLAGAIGSAKVLPDSTWTVLLPPLVAGGPYELQVNLQLVKDVYIGDVWLAGGQSNMEWPLKQGVIGAEEEIANADFPMIRFFKVEKDYSAEEKKDVSGGEWKVANADNLPNFSAVAWFFAKQNHLEKKVPVGIIESNWGGTPAEGWTEAKILSALEDRSYTKESKELIENSQKWTEILAENEKRRVLRDSMVRQPDAAIAGEVSSTNYNDGNWRSINLPSANPLEHIAWVRKKFNLTATGEAFLTFPSIEQMAYIYVNGVQIHYKNWGESVPELKIPAEILKKGQNVLTIRAINTWNNKPVIGAKDRMFLTQNGKVVKLEGAWTYSNSIVEPLLPVVEYHNWKPGFMFNAMIAPLTKFAIKGVIWYQGESNASKYAEYRELFGTMITNWRTRWEIGNFPFLFVQLANYMERKELQPESNWAHLREAQRATLELPFTGMVTTIDIGEEKDIHPRNKKDVGERLWLQARKVAFGEKVLASGPVFQDAKIEGKDLVLTFSEVGKGLKLSAGEEVKGFILEGTKGEFHLLKGIILGKDQLKLSIPEGVEAAGIRYAWADNPEVNLVNELNLPAVPFRAEL
ncbi:sialate O-acetylesterase [Algoriphagus alkaliphilus]|uniref:Sialate O-acetylesterase n=1 Tax=Algoriphagus alkaliphilus TaxID=279824 RepID=A0A1G5VDJ9_9BACT|nr:sialate O-acetylesterase [Algoriphagus alkaliphilus]SDA44001.1 sialate O-acetylesterase [Algoriphagus alkaliphilus]